MNIIFIGSNSNSGYGMATSAFKESFKKINNFNIDFKIYNDEISYNKNLKYNIEIILGHPPYDSLRIGSYRIIYFYWETDKLPRLWENQIMDSDEIWAPCNLVKDVCLKAGYKNKIKIIPTPTFIDIKNTYNIRLKNNLSNYFLNPQYYKFYSIFQWQPRKGYNELLSAYFDEFKYGEEVVLILKINPIPNVEIKKIIDEIKKIKNYYNSKANLFLISEYLSNNDIQSLHLYSDCFVLPHYGEGWGMPIHEAAVFGNPIITTKYGGITDFLNNNIYYIDHNIVPVSGMEWNKFYSFDQNWAKPNIDSLKSNMRYVYNNKIKKSNSFDNFSINNISKIIEENIKDISFT